MSAGKWEDYVYPGTQVLRNKADIRDPAELDRFERGTTAIRIQELREKPVRGDFDLQHLKWVSGFLFGGGDNRFGRGIVPSAHFVGDDA